MAGVVSPTAASGSARGIDPAPVERMLKALARAARNVHTYPVTSSMCVESVSACREALRAVPHHDHVTIRVTPRDLIVDEAPLGAGTVIEQELTRRLFRLKVASLDVDRQATMRDLSRFCIDLVESDDHESTVTFAERLAEHGVNTIVPTMAQTPAVLDLGAPTLDLFELMEGQRQRREELAQAETPVSYLYPPDKGWVRLDPSRSVDEVSLVDLVVLADDPADLAQMLVRLTNDGATHEADSKQAALEQKYSDVTLLFSALDPHLAQAMFGKLARAVLDMDPERRTGLLQRTILPGLLDGHADGRVLPHFPDIDLAESVCLLLDLEAAAPEVLSAAMHRLDLPEERRDAVAPLIEERMRAHQGHQAGRAGAPGESGFERHARALIAVNARNTKDFSEYAAFDLSIDAQAEAAITAVRDGIEHTDLLTRQLLCRFQLAHIERNPDLVEVFVRSALRLLDQLEQDGRWQEVVEEVHGYADLGTELRDERPDVANAIGGLLREFCTPSRLRALVDLHERDLDGQVLVQHVTGALGPALVPGFMALVTEDAQTPRARVFARLMSDIASTVAPALVAEIDRCGAAAARTIVRVLGHAGAGQEVTLSRLVEHQDPQLAREALRALAQVATPRAAAMVARQIREQTGDRAIAAEEALLRFPPDLVSAHVREMIGSRDFVLTHPDTVLRLLDRAAQARITGLEPALPHLEAHRFKFWNPKLRQVALKARRVRTR